MGCTSEFLLVFWPGHVLVLSPPCSSGGSSASRRPRGDWCPQAVTLVRCLFVLRWGLSEWLRLPSPYTCCLLLPSAQSQKRATVDTCFPTPPSTGVTQEAGASPLLALPRQAW